MTLSRPARRNVKDKRFLVPGEPLTLRLVIAKVIDPVSQKELACWYLLTNVGEDVAASTVALWYYHRWRMESYFKLLKSGGGLEFAAKRECGGGGVQAGVSPVCLCY
ncbi:hypothetical protein FACS189454_09480 [Planctomycetales bacterium]|nr:hypothetical protein FACS189454_09480 [Planctomycetales bacterium]